MNRVLDMGQLDLDVGALHTADGVRALTPMELRLLRHLAVAEAPVSKEDLLEQVWGYSSAAQSRTVLVTISRLRRKLEANPEHPAHLVTVPGEGYILRAPTAEAGGSSRTNLAADRDAFVGRADLIARLASPSRLTTLLGPGGIGKTRLAHQVARRWLADGAVQGAWSIGLAQTATLDDVASALFRATGTTVPFGDSVRITADLLASLGSVAVILDEAEAFEGTLQVALEAWLDAAPDLRILATSRERLGTTGERVVAVGPLTPEEGRVLMRDRVEAHLEPELVADEALDTIVGLLDGIPLALELAAEHVDVLGVPGLRDALQQGSALPQSSQDRPERQRTLEATLWWTWERLEEAERDAHRRLSVFEDAFDRAAAAAVLDGPAESAIRTLLDRALLRRRAPAAGTSELLFTQLTTVRDFAAARLAEDPAAQRTTRMRYAEHYATLGADGASQSKRLRDRHHLRVAVQHALELQREQAATGAAVGFTEAVMGTGPYGSGVELADRVLAHSEGTSDARRRLQLLRGQLCFMAGRPDAARTELLGVRAEAASAGDRVLEGRAEQALGEIARLQGEHEASLGHKRAALAIQESVGDQRGALLAREGIGAVLFERGHVEEALAWFEELVVDADAYGDARRSAAARLHLSNAASGVGDQARACDLLDQVLSAPVSRSNLQETAHLNAVWPNRLIGRSERALHHAQEALAMGEQSGHPVTVALALTHLAYFESDLSKARALLERGLRELGPDQFATGQALLSGLLGEVLARLGQRTQAEAHIARAHAVAESLGRPDVSAMVLLHSGLAWSALGEVDKAAAVLERAEALVEDRGPTGSPAGLVLAQLRDEVGGSRDL